MTDTVYERCFVIDTETVPDLKAARLLLNMPESAPDAEVRAGLQEYCMPITPGKTDVFIKPILQKIAAIGLVEIVREAQDAPWTVRYVVSTSVEKRAEEDILSRLEALLRLNPRPALIGWNSHGFDLPLLRHRAMALGVAMPTLLFRYPEETPKWKWNEGRGPKPRDYWKRYGDDHIDLMEILSSFGASSKSKMREVAATLGVPSKNTMDGSMVEGAVNQGRMAEVENYVQEDVVALYCVFLAYELSAGKISRASYEASLQNLKEHVEKKGPEAAHLYPFSHYAAQRLSVSAAQALSEGAAPSMMVSPPLPAEQEIVPTGPDAMDSSAAVEASPQIEASSQVMLEPPLAEAADTPSPYEAASGTHSVPSAPAITPPTAPQPAPSVAPRPSAMSMPRPPMPPPLMRR